MPSPDDLTADDRRVLLELYSELSSVDPAEHPKGSPFFQPLLGIEILALRKLIAASFVRAAQTESKG